MLLVFILSNFDCLVTFLYILRTAFQQFKPETVLTIPLVHFLLFSGKSDSVSFQEILSTLYFQSGRGTALHETL